MKNALTIAATLGLISSIALAQDPGVTEATLNKVTTVCQNCHGANGNSVSGTFPRLNGQQAQYIMTQLKNFREHSRSDPHAMAYMWGMASQLDAALVANIAKYYSQQTPTQPQTGRALAAQGKDIFVNGDPDHKIPPCRACHGGNGEGAAEVPRIAGQHADYLKHQLEDFRSQVRENPVMHANTSNMTDSEIEAVVSYLAKD
jgi:cytochrome c553